MSAEINDSMSFEEMLNLSLIHIWFALALLACLVAAAAAGMWAVRTEMCIRDSLNNRRWR